MSKILWKSLLVSPAILGTALAVSSAANAAESPTTTEIIQTNTTEVQIAQVQNDTEVLDQLERYSQEGQGNSINQVTNVNQLRDVSPTDWAYQALANLVNNYNCIVGYPDRTFRGNRALSRYEFAAGLNACLNVIERLIQENVRILREDIDALQRLMQEFEAELAALGARVDNLEGRVAFLEDHQFSTTTKLAGEVIFAGTGSGGSRNDNQAIFGDRYRLELNSSFTGEDRLVTRLAGGNLENFDSGFEFITPRDLSRRTNEDFNSPTTTQTFNLFQGADNDVFVDWLAYYRTLRLGRTKLNSYVVAFGGIWSDFVPTINPYFEDFDNGNGALSTFATENPIYRMGGGAGGGVSVDFNLLKGGRFTAGYLGSGDPEPGTANNAAGNPERNAGLFNGDYGALAQLDVNITNSLTWGVTYVNAYYNEGSAIFGVGSTLGVTGTNYANFTTGANSGQARTLALPAGGTLRGIGVSDDLSDVRKRTNALGTQISWRIKPWVSFSGFFTYVDADFRSTRSSNLLSPRLVFGNNSTRDVDIWTWGGGFAFPDLGKEGNLLGIFAGVPPYVGEISEAPGGTMPIHVEGFYKYQLTDNISITPGVIWVKNPDQLNRSDDQVIGTLRTTFNF
ncbi:MAG: iron uptake porin [Xenococcaceae cyanobacterium]